MDRYSYKFFWVLMVFLFAGKEVFGHENEQGMIYVDHPWSREMPEVAPNSAVYFVLYNKGDVSDYLLTARSPIAGRAELHEHVHEGGLMKMRQVERVMVRAGEQVTFEPMGYHVMLLDLHRQYRSGERFPLTLTFEKNGSVEVEVSVGGWQQERHSHH